VKNEAALFKNPDRCVIRPGYSSEERPPPFLIQELGERASCDSPSPELPSNPIAHFESSEALKGANVAHDVAIHNDRLLPNCRAADGVCPTSKEVFSRSWNKAHHLIRFDVLLVTKEHLAVIVGDVPQLKRILHRDSASNGHARLLIAEPHEDAGQDRRHGIDRDPELANSLERRRDRGWNARAGVPSSVVSAVNRTHIGILAGCGRPGGFSRLRVGYFGKPTA
jgi:hypothetical protein